MITLHIKNTIESRVVALGLILKCTKEIYRRNSTWFWAVSVYVFAAYCYLIFDVTACPLWPRESFLGGFAGSILSTGIWKFVQTKHFNLNRRLAVLMDVSALLPSSVLLCVALCFLDLTDLHIGKKIAAAVACCLGTRSLGTADVLPWETWNNSCTLIIYLRLSELWSDGLRGTQPAVLLSVSVIWSIVFGSPDGSGGLTFRWLPFTYGSNCHHHRRDFFFHQLTTWRIAKSCHNQKNCLGLGGSSWRS